MVNKQADQKIESPLLALRRREEHFLVELGQFGEIEAGSPRGEEAEQELLEEFLEQHLQPRIVICCGRNGHTPLPRESYASDRSAPKFACSVVGRQCHRPLRVDACPLLR